MKAFTLLLVACLLGGSSSGKLPESEQYRRLALQNPEVSSTEQLKRYRWYDFAPLLTQDQDATVGFIGPHCQRLRIRLLDVRRDTADSTRYLLQGKTLVQQQLRDFTGTLVLRQARELRQLAPNGEAATAAVMQAFRGARREGFVLGDYELRESPGRPASGVFRGVARINWYLNRRGQLRYDYVYGEGDGFCNNQFVGTWTSYATGKSLRCNWGGYRIPNSGDFDVGAGEFSPAAKYLPYGWQDVGGATSGPAERAAARRRAARQWWR